MIAFVMIIAFMHFIDVALMILMIATLVIEVVLLESVLLALIIHK